jgi:hypothetical protein
MDTRPPHPLVISRDVVRRAWFGYDDSFRREASMKVKTAVKAGFMVGPVPLSG